MTSLPIRCMKMWTYLPLSVGATENSMNLHLFIPPPPTPVTNGSGGGADAQGRPVRMREPLQDWCHVNTLRFTCWSRGTMLEKYAHRKERLDDGSYRPSSDITRRTVYRQSSRDISLWGQSKHAQWWHHQDRKWSKLLPVTLQNDARASVWSPDPNPDPIISPYRCHLLLKF